MPKKEPQAQDLHDDVDSKENERLASKSPSDKPTWLGKRCCVRRTSFCLLPEKNEAVSNSEGDSVTTTDPM